MFLEIFNELMNELLNYSLIKKHSRFVTHFRILKNSKNKNFNFLNIAQIRLIAYF